jgi:chromosome segregation ATPase
VNAVEWVIESVRSKKPLPAIAEKISWNQLSAEDRKNFLFKANQLSKNEPEAAYLLLQVLFQVAKDDWYKLQVLCYAIQYSGCKEETRHNILNTMQHMLQDLEPKENLQIILHQHSQAIYYYYSGKDFVDAGDLEKALKYWSTAQTIFKYLSKKQQVERIQADIDSLPAIEKLTGQNGTQPAETMLNELVQQQKKLQMQVSALQAQMAAIQIQIDNANAELLRARTALQETQSMLSQARAQYSQISVDKEALDHEREKVKTDLEQDRIEIQQLRAELQKKRSSSNNANAELLRAKAALQETQSRLSQAQAEYSQISLDKEALDQERQKVKSDLEQARIEVQQLRDELQNKNSSPKSRTRAKSQREELQQAKKRIVQLEEQLNEYKSDRILPSFINP